MSQLRYRLGARVVARHLAGALDLSWRSSRWRLVARVAAAVAAGLAPLAVAWLTRLVLNEVVAPASAPLLGLAVALAVAGVAAALLPQLVGYLDAELRRNVTLLTRQRLYAAVNRLAGLARFENPMFHDRLQLATNGVTGPANVVNSGLGIGQSLFTVVGYLGTFLVINPWMVAVVAAAAVPTVKAELALGRSRAAMLWDMSQPSRLGHHYSHLLTSVTSAQEIRLYGLGSLFGARMLTELSTINAEERRIDRREIATQAVLSVLGAVVAGAGLVWAVSAARSGRLTVGDVALFVAAVAGVQAGVSSMIGGVGRVQESLLSFDHYQAIIDTEPDLAPVPSGRTRPVAELRTGIELRDVWFRYGDDLPWVLRGVNLTLPVGRATALVGLNGSGKSTLVKLLCRLYDPTRGAVLWDGVDIRELSVDELRRRVGAVFQRFMEYELSAAENIGLGDAPALDDRAKIEAAATRAGIHGTLHDLPRGYDTMLTRIFLSQEDKDDPTTGVVLSGGQWQRVALARALMRDRCDLLILDEPSAGLDAEAEHEIHQRLARHRAGRTSLLISHRLNAVRDADTIVVLADGVITEHGNHDALLTANGSYARLFTLQSTGYRDA